MSARYHNIYTTHFLGSQYPNSKFSTVENFLPNVMNVECIKFVIEYRE